MAKITAEMVADFIRLHRQGQSYRAIGERYKVDGRTVKARIDKARKGKEEEYLETVTRQVDAKYLDEHYRLLLHVALAVLSAVRTQPLFARAQDRAEALLHRMTEGTLGEPALDLLTGRGVDLDTLPTMSVPDEVGETPKRRLVQRLFDGLMEHEAALSQAVEQWVGCWDRFQERRAEYGQEAQGLFLLGETRGEAVATALGAAVADEVLRSTLLHHEMGTVAVEDREEGRAVVVLVRGSSREAEDICSGEAEMESAVDAYAHVLSQLQHEGRIESVVAAHKLLMKGVSPIEDLVDILVLRGHPLGRCALCANSLATTPRIIAAHDSRRIRVF